MDNVVMAATYLTAKYKDKDRVKDLGARYDGERQKWYVPEGRDLAPFAAWLPPDSPLAPGPSVAIPESTPTVTIAEPAPATSPASKGMRLSQLLAEVAEVVSRRFPKAVWTTVEAVEERNQGGEIFLVVTVRDA